MKRKSDGVDSTKGFLFKMNREIKFRAIRTDNSEWIKGNYAKTIIGNYDDVTHQILPFGENVMSVFIDVNTLGQFTGLEDKNGKDIYEGDICKYGDFKRLICFEDGSFTSIQYGLHGRRVITSPFGFNNLQGYHEVIGNIHENPELLNG